MLAEAPAVLLDEWSAYYSLEPFGQVRGDLQAGQVCMTLQHIGAAQAGIMSEVEASDYIMTFGEKTEDEDQMLSPEESFMVIATWANAQNARLAAGGEA
jgi:hypothetical protein